MQRSRPCLPWLVANLPTSETGRPTIDRDIIPWDDLKYLRDTRVNVPVPGDRVFVSSSYALFPSFMVWWKENSGRRRLRTPRLTNSPLHREDQCAIFTPMSHL